MARSVSLLVLAGTFILTPNRAFAQTYQVSVEESGALPTAYTKRFNWRYYLTVYRHTTMVPKAGAPTLCSESACLDDNLSGGGLPPDLTRGGTATATVSGMTPGKYRLELRYNQTVNRTTSVPWKIDTDAATNESRSGNLDQRNTTPGTGNWLVLGQSGQSPIDVQSSAKFTFGSDTITFNGSLSYGGIRLVRVGPLVPPADAGSDSGAGDASADSGPSGDAGSDAHVDDDAALDSGAGGVAGGAGAPNDAATPSGGGAGGLPSGGVVPADDAGCSCSLARPRSTGVPLAGLAAAAALLGLARRTRAQSRRE